jgi:para-nitrobenzyl esterase
MIQTRKLADGESMGTRFADNTSIEKLRELSTAEVMQRFGTFAKHGPQNQFGPIVDGYALTDDPQSKFARGEQQKLPIMIGNNAREGFGRMPDDAVRGAIEKTFGANAAAALREYSIGDALSPTDAVMGTAGAMFLTDTSFRCGSVITASRHAATGSPVYQYQFEQSLPGKDADGAAHSYELPFVFGNLLPDGVFGGAYTPADRALSDAMLTYWTNFAKTGNPNSVGTEWPRFDGKKAYIHLASRFDGSVKADEGLRRNVCQLYEQSLTAR